METKYKDIHGKTIKVLDIVQSIKKGTSWDDQKNNNLMTELVTSENFVPDSDYIYEVIGNKKDNPELFYE